MNYTSSSVFKLLQASDNLIIRGGIQCPQNNEWVSEGNTPCGRNPQKCSHVKEQNCKQKIVIFDRHTKLCVLTFYFTISSTNYDGFIDENDMQMKRLLIWQRNQGNPINIGLLVKCHG